MCIWTILFLPICLAYTNLTNQVQPRIIFSGISSISYYPYAVFLHFVKTKPHYCGSSLISSQAVVTSAACMTQTDYQQGGIRAFLGSTIPLQATVVRRVKGYRIHPRSIPETGEYNLAIGFFNSRAPLGNDIQKIPIARSLPVSERHVFTCGWGRQKPRKFRTRDFAVERSISSSRQYILPVKYCKKASGVRLHANTYWCTKALHGLHQYGDSGGYQTKEPRFLIGVISFVVDEYTVYSSLIREQKWVDETIFELYLKHCENKKKLNNG